MLEFSAALPPEEGCVVRRDLAYGPLPQHRLDMYAPEAVRQDAPLIIFFHGGGWRRGSKDVLHFVGGAFASRGFVTAIPDYGLFPEVRFPGFVEDAARAVAWLQHAPGLPRGRCFLAGHSAGAHIAALLALDARYLEAAGAVVPDGAFGIATPTDILSPPHHGRSAEVFDGPLARQSQVIFHAERPGPPLLLLQGGADRTIRPEQGEALARRRREAGHPVSLITYEGLGHLGILAHLAAPLRESGPPVLDDIAAFVNGAVLPAGPTAR